MNEDERPKLPPYPEFWQNYGEDGEQIPVTKAKVDAAFAEMYRRGGEPDTYVVSREEAKRHFGIEVPE